MPSPKSHSSVDSTTSSNCNPFGSKKLPGLQWILTLRASLWESRCGLNSAGWNIRLKTSRLFVPNQGSRSGKMFWMGFGSLYIAGLSSWFFWTRTPDNHLLYEWPLLPQPLIGLWFCLEYVAFHGFIPHKWIPYYKSRSRWPNKKTNLTHKSTIKYR